LNQNRKTEVCWVFGPSAGGKETTCRLLSNPSRSLFRDELPLAFDFLPQSFIREKSTRDHLLKHLGKALKTSNRVSFKTQTSDFTQRRFGRFALGWLTLRFGISHRLIFVFAEPEVLRKRCMGRDRAFWKRRAQDFDFSAELKLQHKLAVEFADLLKCRLLYLETTGEPRRGNRQDFEHYGL